MLARPDSCQNEIMGEWLPPPLVWLEGLGGVALTVATGAAAYLVQGAAELHAERRRAELARVDAQLERLYGPLLAALTTAVAVFKLFAEERVGVAWPGGMPELMRRVREDESLRAEYEQWMAVSVLPQHDRAARLLQEQIHLLEDRHMPQYLLDYVAMTAAYRVIRAKWDAGDHTMLFSPLRMPPGLDVHVRDTFDALKRRQAQLLEGASDPVISLVLRWVLPGWARRLLLGSADAGGGSIDTVDGVGRAAGRADRRPTC